MVVLQQKDNSKEIQKLKEEKLSLTRQLMDLEGESVLYKKSADLLSDPAITYTIENFSFSLSDKKAKQKMKEGLKNKNEEILNLKSELMKKDQLINQLQKKIKSPTKQTEKEVLITQTEGQISSYKQMKVMDKLLFRNKSDLDFFSKSLNKFKNKFLNAVSKNKPNNQNKPKGKSKVVPIIKKEIPKPNNKEKELPDFLLTDRSNYGNEGQLNVTMTQEGDDLTKRMLEKNIYSEIRLLMEEKKNFLLQTMVKENFAFDILSNKAQRNESNSINKKDNKSNKKTSSTVNSVNSNITTNDSNFNPSTGFNLTQDIDTMIEIIKQRKKFVENEKKNLQKLKHHCD
ncbi:MAG: hypothetical protein MJ252_04215 [archaeon]|nr:hypothetical protein [archaeon]